MVVTVRGLSYRYARRGPAALAGASLEVAPASLHALLGPNGAGKSTLIGCLAGLLAPAAGEVRVLGRALPRERARALGEVGFAFETAAFFGDLSGAANLRAFAGLKGVPRAEADALLERLGLGGRAASQTVGTYSLGMRQRLSLARALLGRPRLVVLDEPFNALDPDGVTIARAIVRERRDRDGTAFLISSHDLLEMERLADRVTILRAGEVVCEDALEALLRRAGAHWRFEVGETEKARAALGAAAFAAQNGSIDVRATRAEVPGFVERLVGAGVPVFGVREVVPTLEDVFREVAGP